MPAPSPTPSSSHPAQGAPSRWRTPAVSPLGARGAPTARAAYVSLSDVLAGLSRALDITDGQPAGHALRACAIGMRLADELGLADADRSALYYALLLKDAGCSSNAARFAAAFGARDQQVKGEMKLVDLHSRWRTTLQALRLAGAGQPIGVRMRQLAALAREPALTHETLQIRCERGAAIARRIGFPEATAQAIRSLDEHWCGLGHPEGLRGEAIPLLARICLLAQTLEIFHARDGVRAAIRVVSRRSGTWFDPSLVRVVRTWKTDEAWWASLQAPDCAARVRALEPPALARRAGPPELDRVAEAFADIIDTKSPFTYRHSTHVALLARGTARVLGLHADEVRQIWRAGLLHDVGKLGVSNRILDKPGRLDPQERSEVERHPAYTWEILSRVDAFADFAFAAATHHEKLDGSGYPWGLRGPQLDRASRILAVADIYEAITADRPYRAGMCHDAAMTILEKDRGVKYDADAVDALGVFVEGTSWSANDA